MTNIINFAAAKWISLATIGVVNNLSPVCCVVLCYFMLGETLARKEIIFLTLIVICIFDIVIFAPKSADVQTKSIKEVPYLYLALFCNPFLTAGGTIALRKVKKIHEYVISFWLNLTTLLLNLVFIYALGQQFIPVL